MAKLAETKYSSFEANRGRSGIFHQLAKENFFFDQTDKKMENFLAQH